MGLLALLNLGDVTMATTIGVLFAIASAVLVLGRGKFFVIPLQGSAA